jgi:YD repeat-containing protein
MNPRYFCNPLLSCTLLLLSFCSFTYPSLSTPYNAPLSETSLSGNKGTTVSFASPSISMAYFYGYGNSLVTAKAVNAKAGEIFFDSYEEKSGWEGIISPQYGDRPITSYDATRSRAGKFSARIDKSGSGEYYTHSNKVLSISLSAPTKFKLSGWVYSTGPSVDIFLFMKRTTESSYFSYVDNLSTSVTNQWVYIEKDITVPADVTRLNVRIDNNGGGSVWFEDIRLHPSAARMTSYTYDPLVGKTSETDENNVSTHYEYDEFGRLRSIKDQFGNIRKSYVYHTKNQL